MDGANPSTRPLHQAPQGMQFSFPGCAMAGQQVPSTSGFSQGPSGTCVAAGQESGIVDEQVTIPVTTGDVLYFIVDANGSATSGFHLSVSCNKQ